MENLVVGEGSLDLNTVAEEMKSSKSFVILVKNWKMFGYNLGVNDVRLLDLERKLKLDDVELESIHLDILRLWTAEKGTKATLMILHDALVECGVRDIAESLENMSCNTTPQIDSWQQLVKRHLVSPQVPIYYIPRTLYYIQKPELNSEIFSADSTKEHTFLFKGMTKSELGRLTRYEEVIDVSGNQLETVTTRFILLECDEDFNRICKKTSKSMHFILHKDSHYFWIRSSPAMGVLREYLRGEEKTIEENEMSNTIMSTPSPCALSVADTPGMGKTLVLAHLAKMIDEIDRCNAVKLFINIGELFYELNETFSVVEAITAYVSIDKMAKPVLAKMLQTRPVYLFLDGYDELDQGRWDFVDAYLNQLQTLNNVKVILTTRPHLQTRVENIFKQLAYKIRAFTESNQINFLTRYWENQYGVKKCTLVEEFARKCLTNLKLRLTDKESEIAGIPLQCMMLAEVYADDAERASKLEALREDVVKPMSFIQMYKNLMQLKFSRIPDPNLRQIYWNAHVLQSIELLFQEWAEAFEPFLQGLDEVEENTLYFIGLIEKVPYTNVSRFIHRTFAEYLLAEFIVKNLKIHNEFVDFLFKNILGQKGAITERTCYELKYPVIAYFIEMHLSEFVKQNPIDELFLSKHVTCFANFNSDDVCVAISTCCRANLENIMDYCIQVSEYLTIEDELRKKYFKFLIYVAIENSEKITMLKKVLIIDLGITISPTFTPLHVAVREGKYNFVTYLIKLYGKEVRKLKGLMHICIENSRTNSASVIDEKLLIIDLLVSINHGWLEEPDKANCKPILVVDIHLNLLRRLVEHGANINAYCSQNTVLRTSAHRDTYTDLVRWALANGFNRINHGNYYEETPLMFAIKRFGTLDDEVLGLLNQAKVNFNAQSRYTGSVLFYALQYSKSVHFIRKIVEYGANVNYTHASQNAAHVVVNGQLHSKQILNVLNFLECRGFKLFKGKDSKCRTALDYAKNLCLDNDVIEFLKSRTT